MARHIGTRHDTRQKSVSSPLSTHGAAHGQAQPDERDDNTCFIVLPCSSTTEIGSPRKNIHASDDAANVTLCTFFEGDLVCKCEASFFL